MLTLDSKSTSRHGFSRENACMAANRERMVQSGVVALGLTIAIVAAPVAGRAQSLPVPSESASTELAGALKATFRFLVYEHLARVTFQSKTRAIIS